MRIKLLLSTFSFLLCFTSFSQPWKYGDELKSSKDSSFQALQNSFNEYWANRTIEKGKGWKQFKRWEHFMKPRLYPDQALPSSRTLYEEFSQKSVSALKSGGYSWSPLGPSIVPKFIGSDAAMGAGRINCIEFHPTKNNTLWAGAPSGGFWISTDGGKNWETTTDQLPAIGISDIVVDYNRPDTLYIATGDGDAGDTYSLGILKSTDGGYSWDTTSLSFTQNRNIVIRRLAMDPNNPSVMLAATSKGIYKTVDGWATYQHIKSRHFKDIDFHVSNSNIVFAGQYSEGGNAYIHRSTDGGKSFSKVTLPFETVNEVDRIEIATTKANTNVVYALLSDARDGGFHSLVKSTDSGASWERMEMLEDINLFGWEADGSDEGGQGWYDIALAVSPTDEDAVFVGGVNIWKTINSGYTWKLSSNWQSMSNDNYVHADIHDLQFNSEGKLFAASDGGVNFSKNNGREWESISDGLEILQVYHCDVGPKGKIKLAGAQDNGTFIQDENGDWHAALDGDGFGCFIDPDNPNVVYMSVYYGGLYKSYNQGRAVFQITPSDVFVNNQPTGDWDTPFILSKHNSEVLYAGYSKLYKSINAGIDWKPVSPVVDSVNKLTTITESESDKDVIYIANINTVLRTLDGGRSWDTIGESLPNFAITDIAVHPADPQKLWVSFSGYNEGAKVYYSFNGGESFENYSDGLPNLPVNTLTYVSETNNVIYAGTDNGVFFRNNARSEWEKVNGNLPSVVVNQIIVNDAKDKITVGTYGRGLWEADLFLDSSSIYFVDFVADFNKVCADSSVSVTFTNTSFGQYESIEWDFGPGAVPARATGVGPHAVSFPKEGKYSVSISATNSWGTFTEQKYNYIEAVSEIDQLFADDFMYHCDELFSLEPKNSGEFTWYVNNDSVWQGAFYVLESTDKNVVSIKGKQGKCKAADSIITQYMPDDVCAPIHVSLGLNGPYSNECGTSQQFEPVPDTLGVEVCNSQTTWCPEGGIQNSLWFTFTATESGMVHIEAPGFDNQLALYQAESCIDILSGDNKRYKILAANDDYDEDDYSGVIYQFAGLNPGETYWLQVDGSGGGKIGEFYLDISETGPLNANFSSNTVAIAPGESVNFTDESLGIPDSWEWNFKGGTPSKSTEQNPEGIQYNGEGTFDVQLIVSKDGLSDTITKQFLINVKSGRFICNMVTNESDGEELYRFEDGSFVSGTNLYGDRSLAEYFWVNGDEIEIAGMSVKFGYATSETNPDISFSIMSGQDFPVAKLGTETVELNKIVDDFRTGSETYIGFNPQLKTEKSFFASVDIPRTAGDTIAVYSSSEGSANNNAYLLDARNYWSTFNWKYGNNFNLKISAEVCVGPDKITSMSMGPVPAHKKLTLFFGRFEGKVEKIAVTDYMGKSVYIDKEPVLTDGKYELFTATYQAGVYIIKIESDQGIITQKFIKK